MGSDYKSAPHCTLAVQSNAAIGANLTQYIGVGCAVQANPNWASFRIPYAGILRNMYARASGAPGAGETFDYTVYINGIVTAITCQTVNPNLESDDLVNQVAVNAGDYVCVEVITSLAAAAQLHSVGIELHG